MGPIARCPDPITRCRRSRNATHPQRASARHVTRLSHEHVKRSYGARNQNGTIVNPVTRLTDSGKDRAAKNSSRGAGLGVLSTVVSLSIVGFAILELRKALNDVDYNVVFAQLTGTNIYLIGFAVGLVATSYASLTLYDLLALRTIGQGAVPYRIAALASFTSYPIAHGTGAVALVSPFIRFRIYSFNGLGIIDVANISFLTGLTFWLGNFTALGLCVIYEPGAIGLLGNSPLQVNRVLAAVLLLAVLSFTAWTWLSDRTIAIGPWSVRLPSGPMVLVQIAIGLVDLGAAALAMYVLIPVGLDADVLRVIAVFIAATIGFASHTPAGLGVFDAAILIGLGGDDKEPLIATLLMFRLLYHLIPFILALALLGAVEGWRALRSLSV